MIEIEQEIYEIQDVTFYKPIETIFLVDEIEEKLRQASGTNRRPFAYDCSLGLTKGECRASGRVLACRSYVGKQWSMTFRRSGKAVGPPISYARKQENLRGAGYRPSSEVPRGCLNSIKHQCDLLSRLIFGTCGDEAECTKDHTAQGIIVVAGATGVAKSQIVRGLIHDYLSILNKQDVHLENDSKKPLILRRRHLVTFEDPVEAFWDKVDNRDEMLFEEDPVKVQGGGIDYTPRQKGIDAESLDDVLSDALRQKPSAVYIGETRDDKDWVKLLGFGGTGHLAFTTFHAGSLVEAMHKILKAAGAETPEGRSQVAQRILALIHLRQEVVGRAVVLLPALWLWTRGGANNLTSDGLSSLLPYRRLPLPAAVPGSLAMESYLRRLKEDSTLGRIWFANHLAPEDSGERQNILRKAIELDLQGV